MIGADLSEANLSGQNLEKQDLRRANLAKANLKSALLMQASLARANLDEADLEEANLEGANLKSASLRNANLKNANLKGSDLSWADLRGANLDSASLEGSILDNARLDDAILDNVRISGITYTYSTIWPEGFVPSSKLMTMEPTDVVDVQDLIQFLSLLSQTRAIDYKGAYPDYLKSLVVFIERANKFLISPQDTAFLFNDAFFQSPLDFDIVFWAEKFSTDKSTHKDYQKAQLTLYKIFQNLQGISNSELFRMQFTVQEFLFGIIESLANKQTFDKWGWPEITEMFEFAFDLDS